MNKDKTVKKSRMSFHFGVNEISYVEKKTGGDAKANKLYFGWKADKTSLETLLVRQQNKKEPNFIASRLSL